MMDTGHHDNEIIQSVLRGNQQAYTVLVNRYKNYAFTIALRYAQNREDAEEIAQDAFIKAYRFLNDFKMDQAKFSTWLYTIVTNTGLSFLRKKKQYNDSLDDENVFASADRIDSGMNANLVESKSKVKMVNEAIKLLSPDDANIITLFYQAEQSIEEISQILGTDTSATKVRLHRARTRLKEKMEKHFAAEVKDLYSL